MLIPEELKFLFSKIQIHGRKKLYFGAAGTLIAACIAAVIPYIYGRLVDIALKPDSSFKIILAIVFLWLFLSLLRNLLDYFGEEISGKIAVDMHSNLHIAISSHLLSLPLSFHKEKKLGAVMERVRTGIERITFTIIQDIGFYFLPQIISFFVALLILLFVQWQLSLILVAASFIYVIITVKYVGKITKTQQEMHRAYDNAYGDVWDAALNAQAVKSTANEEFERKKNIKNFHIAGAALKKHFSLWQWLNLWQSMIFTFGFVAVMAGGILMLRNNILSPGKLIMFVGYIGLLTSPLSQLANHYRRGKSAIVAFRRLMKYYAVGPEKDFAGAVKLEEIKGKVAFENACFAYKKDREILKNISFEVDAGETVAIVGESGVGKTTIVDLIGRYYFPTKGRILIDGIDIRKIKLKFLRENMALVPQEVLLFNDSVKNNIRYGKIQATDEEIYEAAKAANAYEFIENFPKKYEQIVGERGIKLSAGQKQRIAIARAVLRNPKILILDEATSALDSVSEKFVQEALEKLIKNRTTFVIAHRLSTIKNADKIIVLEKGQIAEMGNHEELMKNPEGIYRNFWELQSAIQKIE